MEARGSSIQVWMNGGALNTRGLRCGIERQKGPQQEVSQQLRRATGDFESNSTEKNQLEHHSLRGPPTSGATGLGPLRPWRPSAWLRAAWAVEDMPPAHPGGGTAG